MVALQEQAERWLTLFQLVPSKIMCDNDTTDQKEWRMGFPSEYTIGSTHRKYVGGVIKVLYGKKEKNNKLNNQKHTLKRKQYKDLLAIESKVQKYWQPPLKDRYGRSTHIHGTPPSYLV